MTTRWASEDVEYSGSDVAVERWSLGHGRSKFLYRWCGTNGRDVVAFSS
jgi:hypothetical protein